MNIDIATVLTAYKGSDGDLTRQLYAALSERGPSGLIAIELFRACKSSERAKVYRGGRGGFRGAAYGRKEWALGNLCTVLDANAAALSMTWGWGIDEKQPVHRHVLYVDLPTGQVSFHAGARGAGPDYPGRWDGQPGQSADRICRWIGRFGKAVAA